MGRRETNVAVYSATGKGERKREKEKVCVVGVSCKSSVHSLPQGREFYGRRRRRSSCVKQTHSRSPQTNENRKLYKYNNFVRSEQQLVVFEKDKNRTQPQPFEKKRKKTVTKRLAR